MVYLRVSTEQQRKSGLGIEAQRSSCLKHIKQSEGQLAQEFVDFESGKKVTRIKRPELFKALKMVKSMPGSQLLLARTDRLARDLYFICGLLNDGINLVVAGHAQMTKLEWHMHGMIAEHERDLISSRTKQALHEAKKRGVRLGAPADKVNEISEKGGKATALKNRDYREKMAPLLLRLMNDKSLRFEYKKTIPNPGLIADQLNNVGLKTISDKPFTRNSVLHLIRKLTLRTQYEI